MWNLGDLVVCGFVLVDCNGLNGNLASFVYKGIWAWDLGYWHVFVHIE